jgi:putative endonuclease
VKYFDPSSRRWYVYLLKCSDGSLYCGSTNNLIKRIKDHGAGVGARYTRSRLPITLVYSEVQESRPFALKRELEIKSWPKERKIELVTFGRKGTRRKNPLVVLK